MSITNYTELQSSIARALNNQQLTSMIPDFIVMAEDVFTGSTTASLPGIRGLNQEKRVTASISSEYTDLPGDFLEMRSLQINTSTKNSLEYFGQKQLVMSYPHSSTGEPRAYSIIGDELQVRPAPDTTYTAEMRYVARFFALSDDNSTNWLLTNHPSAYLYASLMHAYGHAQDEARARYYGEMYRAKADSLNRMIEDGKYGDTLTGRADMMTP